VLLANGLLEVFPCGLVVAVEADETSIVESSIVELEDVLVALAPLEAGWELEEGDVVLVGAVGDALLVASEFFHGVLLYEDSEFLVEGLLTLEVGLEGWSNGLEEFLAELISKASNVLGVSDEVSSLLLEGSLGHFGDLEITSASTEAAGFEVESLRGVSGVEALDSAVLVALGVGLDVLGKGGPAFNGGDNSLSEVQEKLGIGVLVRIGKSLSDVISGSLGGISPELPELESITIDGINSGGVN
jgi:hypothetical protein